MRNSWISHFRNPNGQPSHIAGELTDSNKNIETVRKSLPNLNCPAVGKIQAPRAEQIMTKLKVITKTMNEKEVLDKSFVNTTFLKESSEYTVVENNNRINTENINETKQRDSTENKAVEPNNDSILKCKKTQIKNIETRKKRVDVPIRGGRRGSPIPISPPFFTQYPQINTNFLSNSSSTGNFSIPNLLQKCCNPQIFWFI